MMHCCAARYCVQLLVPRLVLCIFNFVLSTSQLRLAFYVQCTRMAALVTDHTDRRVVSE